jgi:hypothetical protein
MANKSSKKPTPKKYDPSKSYQWNEDAVLSLTGLQFDKILKGLQARASTPEFQVFLMEKEALDTVTQIFVKNVENGTIYEMTPPAK